MNSNRPLAALGAAALFISSLACGSASEADPCTPDEGVVNTVCSEDGRRVLRVDSCGDEAGSPLTCSADLSCVADSATEASCGCAPSDPPMYACYAEGAQKIDNPTEIGLVDACGYFVSETPEQTCMLGERCWYEWDEDGEIVGAPFCATSIDPKHRDKEHYVRGCDNEIYMHAQTTLQIDCRCNRSNMDLPHCRATPDAYDRLGLRLGSGPVTRDINFQQWGGGFLDPVEKELVVSVHYTGGEAPGIKPGAIYAVNYETGDRRVLSGSYYDEEGRHDVGGGYTFEGEAFPFLVDLELGPDGQIYAAGSDTLDNVEITRVDPETGDRALVWRRQNEANAGDAGYPFGQCWSGRVSNLYPGGFSPVQYALRAFTMDAEGNFYLGFHNDGVGVVKISSDGSTCAVLSRWASRNNTAPLPDVGAGPTFQYDQISGMLHHGGEVYAVTEDTLIAIDEESGDRRVFSNAGGIGGIGETNFFHDPTRDVLFACGTDAARKCSVHRMSDGNDAQGLFRVGTEMPVLSGKYPQTQGAKGSLDNNNRNAFGAVLMDPADNNILYFVVSYGFIKYEIDTGNSYTFSL